MFVEYYKKRLFIKDFTFRSTRIDLQFRLVNWHKSSHRATDLVSTLPREERELRKIPPFLNVGPGPHGTYRGREGLMTGEDRVGDEGEDTDRGVGHVRRKESRRVPVPSLPVNRVPPSGTYPPPRWSFLWFSHIKFYGSKEKGRSHKKLYQESCLTQLMKTREGIIIVVFCKDSFCHDLRYRNVSGPKTRDSSFRVSGGTNGRRKEECGFGLLR